MRAATPKADTNLRPKGTLSEPGVVRGAEVVHPFPGTDLAGVRPLRPGLHEAAFTRTAANDALRRRPRPLAPALLAALVMLLDMAVLVAAGLGADALTDPGFARHTGVTLLAASLTLGCGFMTGAYAHPLLFSGRRQFRRIGTAGLAALAVTLAAAAAFGALWRITPDWLAAAFGIAGFGLLVGRAGTAAMMRRMPRTARRTAILGAGPQAARLAAALRRDPAGLDLIGLADERGGRGVEPPAGLPMLGGLAQLTAMIRRGELDVVVIALPWSSEGRINALVEQLSALPVELRLAPDLMAARLGQEGEPVVPPLLCARPISGVSALLKFVSDYLLAGTALAVAAVPMLLIALAVKLDSPGPVLFRQRRTGFNDQFFDVFKFRTMYEDETDHEAMRQVLHGDPRVTRVGAILRRTSLDELPQLFNVLRGEMSFVGPRPHAPGTRAGNRRFDEVVANYAARHRVKPGLTGLAQVRGFRGPTPSEDQILRRVESDLEYIARWSLWLDFIIILRTLLVVVRMRNAC
ncbi:exopolysaccharide biosynthesis polyprenyl glycosylphosphotransferase [Falsiroseomonas sp.]|uniref:exopolysaccharide biosynthesis polyprenyl glycosylphosphotransferase n=1 Tax=Falsiroseomonas sp. TaxID=2870721 RepID=UPI00356A8AA8